MPLIILLAGLILALSGLATDHVWWVGAGTLTVGIQVGRAVERITWAVREMHRHLRHAVDTAADQLAEAAGIAVLTAIVIAALMVWGGGSAHH